nr:hypothetical protein [Tanacetum cinerariifolium]
MIGGGLIGGGLDNNGLDNGCLDNGGLDNDGLDNDGLDNGGLDNGEQVKTMRIQAGIQVSRPKELRRQLQLWKRFGRLYLIVFVLVRNIVSEPKRKKAKKDVFTVNLYYDGLFTSCPLIYFQGQCRVLTDTNFDEMTYVHLLEILKREIKSDQYIMDLLKVGYDNGFQIHMYVDHFGYDIMEMVECDRNEELRKTRIKSELDSSDDDYHYSDDLEEIENVDFHTKGDDSVVIKNITTQDLFLTKLCSARILFRSNVGYGVNEKTPQVDPDDNQIDPVFKVKKGVVYPAFDSDIPWDKMEPILGMRNVVKGRCLDKKGNKHRVLPKKRLGLVCLGGEGNQASKKPVNKKPDSQSGEGTSQLIEHYAKLYQYRQELLNSNPGSTCILDVVESHNGSVSFKRMYICFKGANDGWLAGCRKVIGLDGCFLKHTCKGELLTVMGRNANNQMYPITWAVVRVENANSSGWFLHLLHDDLCLNDGTGITIISDSHKGLIDAVRFWSTEIRTSPCFQKRNGRFVSTDRISPVSLFDDMSNDSNWLKFPIGCGIQPLNSLCDMLKRYRALSWPIVSGTTPEKQLLEISMDVKSVKILTSSNSNPFTVTVTVSEFFDIMLIFVKTH